MAICLGFYHIHSTDIGSKGRNIYESGEEEEEFHFNFMCTALYNNITATFLQHIGTCNIILNIKELNDVNQM